VRRSTARRILRPHIPGGIMRRLLFAAITLFIAVFAAHAEVGDRHVEPSGGYALRAPKGWQFREFPGLKYQVAFLAMPGGFSPNLNVVDEGYGGPLKSYVDENTKVLKKTFTGFKLVKRVRFVTASGVQGEKMITVSQQQKTRLRQAFYLFPGRGGKYFVVTCSTPAEKGDAFDAAFDESLKTFELVD
jgi:hypothetical protein